MPNSCPVRSLFPLDTLDCTLTLYTRADTGDRMYPGCSFIACDNA